MMADINEDDADAVDSSETEASFSAFATQTTDQQRQLDHKSRRLLFISILLDMK